MDIVADIETNGLLDMGDKLMVHSLVLRDLATGDLIASCTDEGDPVVYRSIATGLALLQQANRVYFHNGIKFDYPALRMVYPTWDMDRSKLRDTYVIASMRFAHIMAQDYENAKKGKFPNTPKYIGAHSLGAWGHRLGVYKGDYTGGWETWSPEMQSYCEQDTETGRALVQHLRASAISDESMAVEHDLAWYLARQENNGWPFDVDAAAALAGRLSARRHEIEQGLIEEFGYWYAFDGEKTPTVGNKTKGITKGVPFSNVKRVDFNPASRHHIANRLQTLYGWQPTDFTKSGQPEINEKTLADLNADVPAVKKLFEFLLVEKRLSVLSEGKQAFLRHTKTDTPAAKRTGLTHIHHRVKQNHAITHRASHVTPPIAGTPKVGSLYGAEFRALFGVPKGWVEVGADAASLEARCLAHYLHQYPGGPEYAQLVVSGDVHTANRIALGLPGDTPLVAKVARDGTKNWFYAMMYGAGDPKLGKMLAFIQTPDGTRLIPVPAGGWTVQRLATLGKGKRAQFLRNISSLGALTEDVKRKSKAQGYLTSIDGRRVYTRSDHSALNSLLQCAGALICKRWIVNFDKRLTAAFGPQGWDGKWAALGWIHDEVQLAVRPEIADAVCAILVEEMQALTQHFKWNVPLDGEAKIGANWKETH